MNEGGVARQTFGNKFKASGPNFFLDGKLDQTLDIWKNIVTANASQFYEFGVNRTKGRLRKSNIKGCWGIKMGNFSIS
jgi:hypothetical protein